MTIFSARYDSPVGRLTLAAGEQGLAGLWLDGQKYFGDTVDGVFVEAPDMPLLKKARQWLDAYFAGRKPAVSALPLAPAGGEFRREVWKILCEIPYGEYMTYGEIARLMAKRLNRKSMSSQAVGGAVGHNPISIIIPCHRVVGSNGSLTGYAGGIAAQKKLLELEGVDVSRFSTPKKGSAL